MHTYVRTHSDYSAVLHDPRECDTDFGSWLGILDGFVACGSILSPIALSETLNKKQRGRFQWQYNTQHESYRY